MATRRGKRRGLLSFLEHRQIYQHHVPYVTEDILKLVEYKAANPHGNKACELSGQTRSTFLTVSSADGTRLASLHGDHSVRVTEVSTGKCTHILTGHPRTPWCAEFHPSSNSILATGCLGGEVRIWDLHGCGSEVWHVSNNTIASLTFHPVDHVLVIAMINKLYFWDWSQSEPFACCETSQPLEKVRWVKFDPQGRYLYTGIHNVSELDTDEYTIESSGPRHEDDSQSGLHDRYQHLMRRYRRERALIQRGNESNGTSSDSDTEESLAPSRSVPVSRVSARSSISDRLDELRRQRLNSTRRLASYRRYLQRENARTAREVREMRQQLFPSSHAHTGSAAAAAGHENAAVSHQPTSSPTHSLQRPLSSVSDPLATSVSLSVESARSKISASASGSQEYSPSRPNLLVTNEQLSALSSDAQSFQGSDRASPRHGNTNQEPSLVLQSGSRSQTRSARVSILRSQLHNNLSSVHSCDASRGMCSQCSRPTAECKCAGHADCRNDSDRSVPSVTVLPSTATTPSLVSTSPTVWHEVDMPSFPASPTRNSSRNGAGLVITGNQSESNAREGDQSDRSFSEGHHSSGSRVRAMQEVLERQRWRTARESASRNSLDDLRRRLTTLRQSTNQAVNSLSSRRPGTSGRHELDTISFNNSRLHRMRMAAHYRNLSSLIERRNALLRESRDTHSWQTLQRRFLHPDYSSSIFDDTINRPSDALQSAINRAIAGAFIGSGEVAVANNILNTSHRIQRWEFAESIVPDISNANLNVVVPCCKIHSDGNCAVSQDGCMIATFVPSHQGFPDDTILGIFSLETDTLGQCLFTKKFGPNAVSVSISPCNNFVLVGLASRRSSWMFSNSRQMIGQVYRLEKENAGESSMKHTSDIYHPVSPEVCTHVSVNTASWLKLAGQGLVYGTNRGDLHFCLPGLSVPVEEELSDDDPDLGGPSIRRNLLSFLGMNVPRTMNTATQTVIHGVPDPSDSDSDEFML